MKIDINTAGRLRVGDEGHIEAADARLCATMRMSQAEIIGLHVFKVTAAVDRDACAAIFHQIRADGAPVTTVKRIVRADRSEAWVRIAVSTPDWPGSGAVEMAVEECAPPEDWVEPAQLLAIATRMFRIRRNRAAAFGPDMFGDHAWDMLLAAYISEAEGRVLTTADLHATMGVPLVLASRWMRVLGASELVEYEDRGSASLITSSIRLTVAAHRKFERFLSDIHRDKEQSTFGMLPYEDTSPERDGS